VFLLFLGLKSQRREIRSHSFPGVVSSRSFTNSASATRLFFLCFSTCSACLAYHSSNSRLAVLRHSSSFTSSFLSFSAIFLSCSSLQRRVFLSRRHFGLGWAVAPVNFFFNGRVNSETVVLNYIGRRWIGKGIE